MATSFDLPLEQHGVSNHSVHETAIIVHPQSLFSSFRSPTYQWGTAAFDLQRQEVQQLLKSSISVEELTPSKQKQRLNLLDAMCDEHLRLILGYLDGVSLCQARSVNRTFHQLGANDQYWYHLCKAEWAISPDQLRKQPESYLSLYKHAGKSVRTMIRDFFQEQCLLSLQSSLRIPRHTALMLTNHLS